ncbi:MAG: hypothetical protein ACREBU_21350, partial [Nitrososphaera sp.]
MASRREPEGGYWIYQLPQSNPDDLAAHLEELLSKAPKNVVTIFVVVCKQNLFELLYSWHDKDKFDVIKGTSNTDNSIFSFKLANYFGKEKTLQPHGNVIAVRSMTKQIYYVMTDERTAFGKDVLQRFLNSYYPDISRAYISSTELETLLEHLENTTLSKIIADRTTAYARIPYEKREFMISESSKNLLEEKKQWKRETIRKYTSRPFREAFDSAKANDEWIDNVHFIMKDNEKVMLECFISRRGVIRISRSFYPFYQTLAPMINEIIERKFKLYSNRARSHEKPKPEPLVIQFDHDIFTDSTLNRRFVESIRRMTFISISVYHANPYLHLSLVDYLDGSAFELWVFSADKITIVPQLRASEASISRLMNHIFETFREGIIREYIM